MKRIQGLMFVVLAALIAALLPAGPAPAGERTPPVVASSRVPAASEALKMIVDAQVNIEIDALAVTTRNKTVGGKNTRILTNPGKGANAVRYTYHGVPHVLEGWEAVQFLVHQGYFRFDAAAGGLVSTARFRRFGPGATEAVLDDSGKGSGSGSPTGGEPSGGGSSSTKTGAWSPAGGGGGSAQGGGAGGGAPGAGEGRRTTRRRPGGPGGGAGAEFTCEVDLAEGTLFGVAAEGSAYENCIGKVEAKRAECLGAANGDSSVEAVCNTACDRTIQQVCNKLGGGIELKDSPSGSDD